MSGRSLASAMRLKCASAICGDCPSANGAGGNTSSAEAPPCVAMRAIRAASRLPSAQTPLTSGSLSPISSCAMSSTRRCSSKLHEPTSVECALIVMAESPSTEATSRRCRRKLASSMASSSSKGSSTAGMTPCGTKFACRGMVSSPWVTGGTARTAPRSDHRGSDDRLRPRLAIAGKAEFRRQPVRRRAHQTRALLQRLDRQAPDRAGDPERADRLTGKIPHRQCDAAHFRVELAVIEGDAEPPHLGDLAPQAFRLDDGAGREGLEFGAREIALELVGCQRGEYDLAERGAMRGPYHPHALGQLERARPAGSRQHDHRIAHADREMRAFAGLARQFLEDRRRQGLHLDLVERARGKREQGPTHAVSLGILHLPDIAERGKGAHQVKGGRTVQADALAQLDEADAVAVSGDLLEDGEGAPERLHAAARGRSARLDGPRAPRPAARMALSAEQSHGAASFQSRFQSRRHGIIPVFFMANATSPFRNKDALRRRPRMRGPPSVTPASAGAAAPAVP